MDSILHKKIKNISLEKAIKIEDYIQLYFEKRIILSIYNKYSFISEKNEDLFNMKDVKVLGVVETEEEVKIIFENSILVVDLRSEAYQGPEAMGLYIPDEPIVIWNESI